MVANSSFVDVLVALFRMNKLNSIAWLFRDGFHSERISLHLHITNSICEIRYIKNLRLVFPNLSKFFVKNITESIQPQIIRI